MRPPCLRSRLLPRKGLPSVIPTRCDGVTPLPRERKHRQGSVGGRQAGLFGAATGQALPTGPVSAQPRTPACCSPHAGLPASSPANSAACFFLCAREQSAPADFSARDLLHNTIHPRRQYGRDSPRRVAHCPRGSERRFRFHLASRLDLSFGMCNVDACSSNCHA